MYAGRVNGTGTAAGVNDRVMSVGHGNCRRRRGNRSVVLVLVVLVVPGRRRLQVGHRGHGHIAAAVEHGVFEYGRLGGHVMVLAANVRVVHVGHFGPVPLFPVLLLLAHLVLLLLVLLLVVLLLLELLLQLLLVLLLVLERLPFGARVHLEHFHQLVPLLLQLLDLRL